MGAEIENRLGERGLVVEDTPMRGVKLPSTLSAAIEAKLGMEQESQRMEFVLKREEQEAKRKAVEAQGIAEVSAGCGAPDFVHC